jgi:hypothetical protein
VSMGNSYDVYLHTPAEEFIHYINCCNMSKAYNFGYALTFSWL